MLNSFEEIFQEETVVPTEGIDLKGMPKRPLPIEQRRLHSERNHLHAELLEAARTMSPDNDLPTDSFDPLMDMSPMNGNDGDIRFEDGTIILTSPPINPPSLPEGTILSY